MTATDGGPVRLRRLGHLRDLDPDERERWLDAMGNLWVEGLGPHVPTDSTWAREFWNDRRDAYADDAEAYVAEQSGRLVGYQLIGHRRSGRYRYIVGYVTAIDPGLQGRGLAFAMSVRTFARVMVANRLRRVYFASRIFNPIVLSAVVEVTPDLSRFHPSLDPQRSPTRDGVEAAAAHYVATYYPTSDWDRRSSIIRIPDEKPSPPFLTRTGTPVVDNFFAEHLPSGSASLLWVQEMSIGFFVRCTPILARAAVRSLRAGHRAQQPSGRASLP